MNFIDSVKNGFSRCNVDIENISKIGVAVSGGADSVSLLISLVEIFGHEKVFALTVNHNIRELSETKGDADFTISLCEKLCVKCNLVEFPRGEVDKISKIRNGGIEEAARFLRYEAFDKFIKDENLDYLCLAHNQNDQIETAIMRFIQGSGCDGGGGIVPRREKYIRPLLFISRFEIESFLNEKNQIWRTDSTNLDTNYLRNKIRNVLIPNLDSLFIGWKESVINGIEKNSDDNFTLKCISNKITDDNLEVSEDFSTVMISKQKYFLLEKSIQRRVFYEMLSKLKYSNRFPYKLIKNTFTWNDDKNHLMTFDNLEISVDSINLKILKKNQIEDNAKLIETGFCKIVEIENKKYLFRSFQNGDEISMKDGKMKDISKIFSEWKVKSSDKEKITIVQDCDSLKLIALLGKNLGYNDWIVSDFEFIFSTADN